jgi:hypothetical protein
VLTLFEKTQVVLKVGFSTILSQKRTTRIWDSDENVFQIRSICRVPEPDSGILKRPGTRIFPGFFLLKKKSLDPDVLVQLTTCVDAVSDVDKTPLKDS